MVFFCLTFRNPNRPHVKGTKVKENLAKAPGVKYYQAKSRGTLFVLKRVKVRKGCFPGSLSWFKASNKNFAEEMSKDGYASSSQVLREIRFTAKCAHKNVITVFDYFRTMPSYWLLLEDFSMDLCRLAELLSHSGGLLGIDKMTAFMCPILRALRHLERKGIIHRDVRPSNILLKKDFSLALANFSFAVEVEGGWYQPKGAIQKADNLISPEMIKGECYSFNTDVYSWAMSVILSTINSSNSKVKENARGFDNRKIEDIRGPSLVRKFEWPTNSGTRGMFLLLGNLIALGKDKRPMASLLCRYRGLKPFLGGNLSSQKEGGYSCLKKAIELAMVREEMKVRDPSL